MRAHDRQWQRITITSTKAVPAGYEVYYLFRWDVRHRCEMLRTADPRGGGECYLGIPLRSDKELGWDLGSRESVAGQVLSAGTTSTAASLSV